MELEQRIKEQELYNLAQTIRHRQLRLDALEQADITVFEKARLSESAQCDIRQLKQRLRHLMKRMEFADHA